MLLCEIVDINWVLLENEIGNVTFHETDVTSTIKILQTGGIKSIKQAYPSTSFENPHHPDMPESSKLIKFPSKNKKHYDEYVNWISTTTFNAYGNNAGYYQYYGNTIPDVLFVIDYNKLDPSANMKYTQDTDEDEGYEGGLLQIEDTIPLSAISFILINDINGPENYIDRVTGRDDPKTQDERLKQSNYDNIVEKIMLMCKQKGIRCQKVKSNVYEHYRRRLIKLFKRK